MNNSVPQQNHTAKLPASFVILMLFCFCGLLAGFVFYQVTPTTYESNAAFLVRPSGLKLPVENFDFEIYSDGHEKSIVRPHVIRSALDQAKLTGLDSFKEFYSQNPSRHQHLNPQAQAVDHVISNLEVEQKEIDDSNVKDSDGLVYEIAYFESHADDAQTVLNGILDAYETILEQQFLRVIGESTRSLKELYLIAATSLAQEKAKNVSEGVVVRLEERLAEILTQIQALEFYSSSVTKPRLLKFVVLEDATYGEPKWPILYKCLIVGLLAGLLLGIALVVLLGTIKALYSNQIDKKYSQYAAQGREVIQPVE